MTNESQFAFISCSSRFKIAFKPVGNLNSYFNFDLYIAVCCIACAPAMLQCPMCRKDIKGTVKAGFTHLCG